MELIFGIICLPICFAVIAWLPDSDEYDDEYTYDEEYDYD